MLCRHQNGGEHWLPWERGTGPLLALVRQCASCALAAIWILNQLFTSCVTLGELLNNLNLILLSVKQNNNSHGAPVRVKLTNVPKVLHRGSI